MRFRIGLVLMLLAGLYGLTSEAPPTNAGRAALPAGFERIEFASDLVAPTDFAFQGNRIFVSERAGVVRIVRPNGSVRSKPYVTLNVSTNQERGLLGIAIDPKFAKNKYVYVYYTTGPGAKDYSGTPVNRISRFKTKGGVGLNETIIVDNIPSDTGSHDGGALWFGFDKKLYVGIGDGGWYWGDAALVGNLRGKILRLNRGGSAPPNNPFVNRPGADPRIYAYGLRNPFRSAMRPENQSVLVADVGNDVWEEIDSLAPGADYGWYRFEGPCPFDTLGCDTTATDFGTTTGPIHFYHHHTGAENGETIIVGAFPHQSNYPPPYDQALFYGDWVRGWVHVLSLDDANKVTGWMEFDTLERPVSFKTGPDGNVYVLTLVPGKIFKYVYTAP